MIKLLSAKASLIQRHWRPRLVGLGLALNAAWPWSRWLAYRAAWLVLGRPEYRNHAEVWQQIWQARQIWAQGYDQGKHRKLRDDGNVHCNGQTTDSALHAPGLASASACAACANPGVCHKMHTALKEA